jgi:hypothetical protein
MPPVAGADSHAEESMPRERPSTARKRRTREHVIADLGVHHVEGVILRCGFSAERVVHDYGLDLYMTTYTAAGRAESDWVLFQVKATEHLRRALGGATVVIRIERSDLNRWMRETYPVILIVYDARADMGYWLYVQAHCTRERMPAGVSRTVTVHIPEANVLDEAAVRRFAAAKAAVQSQTRGVRHE